MKPLPYRAIVMILSFGTVVFVGGAAFADYAGNECVPVNDTAYCMDAPSGWTSLNQEPAVLQDMLLYYSVIPSPEISQKWLDSATKNHTIPTTLEISIQHTDLTLGEIYYTHAFQMGLAAAMPDTYIDIQNISQIRIGDFAGYTFNESIHGPDGIRHTNTVLAVGDGVRISIQYVSSPSQYNASLAHFDAAIKTLHTKPVSTYFDEICNEDCKLDLNIGDIHELVSIPECTHIAECKIGKISWDDDAYTPVIHEVDVRLALVDRNGDNQEALLHMMSVCPDGSHVVVNEDDLQDVPSFMLAEVWCNGISLNEALMDAKYGTTAQRFCITSEFASRPWADCPDYDVPLKAGTKQGTVTNVVDGDTIDIDDTRYRLNLIDAPERSETGYDAARSEVERLCPVNSVVLYDDDSVQPTDKYGRNIGVVYCWGNQYETTVGEYLYNNNLVEFSSQYCDTSEFATKQWAEKNSFFYYDMCY